MYSRQWESSWDAGDAEQAPPRKGDSEVSSNRAVLAAMPIVDLLGIKLHAITEVASINHILGELDHGRGGVVVTPNLDHLRRYLADVNFGALVAEAELVVADGMPLVWASRLQGTPLPERVAGSNLISSLSAAAAEKKRSIFLLGGSTGTAEGAAKVLVQRHPTLKIAGWQSPPFGFENMTEEMAAIIAAISASKPDIIYVALGSPKQERLIARLKEIMPDSWWLGVGNSFSFLCGDVKRAPRWMQVSGLEWAHRLFQEPRRLFKRYVMVGVPFAVQLLSRSAIRGIPTRVNRRFRRSSVSFKPNGNSVPTTSEAIAAAGLILGSPGLVPQAMDETLSQAPLGIPAALETQLTRKVWATPSSEADRVERLDEGVPLSRLRAMVLLGGAVRTSALSAITGRSVLDLPLDETGSILNFWLAQAAEVARQANLDRLPVRVMVDQNSPEPRSADARYIGAYRVERDLSEYRGTGGVLRDMAYNFEDDDLILVANAAQILLDPLPLVLATLQRKRGDVAVISHDDGTPSGIMLVACKTLRLLPTTGFVDMKEQGLPLIAGKFDVRVVKRRRPTGLPVRSLEGYIQALHYYHRRRSGKPAITDPLAEDWSSSFSIIEPGATVDPSVRVHDSVVLAGGCVEAGAVLVRSVVCPGAAVRRDRSVVDQLMGIESVKRRVFRGLGGKKLPA